MYRGKRKRTTPLMGLETRVGIDYGEVQKLKDAGGNTATESI